MHDAGAILALLSIEVFYLSDQLIHERAESPGIAWCGMRVYARVFAHHEEILVFENDLERSIVWGQCRRDRLYIHLNDVASLQEIFAVRIGFSVFDIHDCYLLEHESFLYLRARVSSFKKSR